jgi:hypothetical protein
MKHLTLAPLAFCLLAACSGPGTSHSSMAPSTLPLTANLSGTLSLSGQMAEAVSSCTGSLSTATYTFCPSYTFALTENAGSFTGTATASCYQGTLSVMGTINGATFTGTASFTSGSGAVLVINFSGSVSGSSMTLSPTSLGLQGTTDTCQVSGPYMGTVQVSGSGGTGGGGGY